jgi:phosphohistidine phosphatase
MTRRLLLLRHAKSSWEDVGLADHDRPLAPRGHRAVDKLRHHLAAVAEVADGASGAGCPRPDLVLCSTARRTVETWQGIAPAFPPDTPVEMSAELYGATAGELCERLRRTPAAAECVLVIAHNPGLEDLALDLIATGDVGLRRQLATKFPTGALATLRVPSPWPELAWGTAELAGYVVPAQL